MPLPISFYFSLFPEHHNQQTFDQTNIFLIQHILKTSLAFYAVHFPTYQTGTQNEYKTLIAATKPIYQSTCANVKWMASSLSYLHLSPPKILTTLIFLLVLCYQQQRQVDQRQRVSFYCWILVTTF